MDPTAEFLSTLEHREAALLSWGLADGSFSEDELDGLAERFLSDRRLWGEFAEADELIERAEAQGLLFPFLAGGTWRYRTRTAEAVRLFLRLRQLFPKHLSGRQWLAAPTLVADARSLIRPRSYPRRHLAPEAAADRLRAAASLDPVQREAVDALVGGRKLAEFQARASESVLRGLQAGEDPAGTIVCAGTGSGKTLAFYLPALVHLCGGLSAEAWPRCLAIYPRNELLKDQFSETYAQVRRLDDLLVRSGRRKVRIGALFGATPRDADSFDSRWPPAGWRRVAGGYACPLLRCPRSGCRGALVWTDDDRRLGLQRLACSGPACSTRTEPGELALTRKSLLGSSPDVLFSTTEMLNQRMGDSRFGRLFGVGTAAGRKPELVLLDEVHTYGGVPGARAAILLRRWLHASRAAPHFVGLSATLRDARRFLAALVGLPVGAVQEVGPAADELEQAGMEYLLALRGDPGSGASLLSTTIQATMLLRRVLDPAVGGRSGGAFGRKLFLFTDALDVTNRLFFDLRDAEGQDSWGNPDPGKPGRSLANLRSPTGPDVSARLVHGQSWDVCERAGHRLGPGDLVRVGRTTSQDAGVDADADVIVATAALEVGFNDPAVGAVLQHKAPMDPAAFLQRKGRAGRDPRMRPWTVVVLSDYGRDRLAYQQLRPAVRPRTPCPRPADRQPARDPDAGRLRDDGLAGRSARRAPARRRLAGPRPALGPSQPAGAAERPGPARADRGHRRGGPDPAGAAGRPGPLPPGGAPGAGRGGRRRPLGPPAPAPDCGSADDLPPARTPVADGEPGRLGAGPGVLRGQCASPGIRPEGPVPRPEPARGHGHHRHPAEGGRGASRAAAGGAGPGRIRPRSGVTAVRDYAPLRPALGHPAGPGRFAGSGIARRQAFFID
jgi:hypothetical protein